MVEFTGKTAPVVVAGREYRVPVPVTVEGLKYIARHPDMEIIELSGSSLKVSVAGQTTVLYVGGRERNQVRELYMKGMENGWTSAEG